MNMTQAIYAGFIVSVCVFALPVAATANPMGGGSVGSAGNAATGGSPMAGNKNWKPRQKTGTRTNSGTTTTNQNSSKKKPR